MSRDFVSSVLQRCVAHLGVAQIPYMIVGSMAAILYGEPRTTRDIDIVIDANAPSLESLVAALLADDYYLDPDTAREALKRRTLFNVIDNREAWKLDMILLKEESRDQQAFNRRQPVLMLGVEVQAAQAEDTVLSKLVWAQKSGGSERQLRDVAGILRVSGSSLDMNYIQQGIDALELGPLWALVTGSKPTSDSLPRAP